MESYKKNFRQQPSERVNSANNSASFGRGYRTSPFAQHAFTAWEWSLEQNTLSYIQSWSGFFDGSPKFPLEISFDECWNNVSEEDMETLRKAINNILNGGTQELDVAVRFRRQDKGWSWVLNRGKVTDAKNGKPRLVSGISLNISRLRSDPVFQRKGIGASSTVYHGMLENSPDMVVRLDRELFPLYMNQKVSRYFKKKREDFTGYEMVDELEMDPRQMDFLLSCVSRVFEEKTTIREMLTFTSAYGLSVTGEYTFWPEFNSRSDVVSVMAQFRDLTEQIQAEERARLNESRLSALNRLTLMEGSSVKEVVDFVLSSIRELTDSFSSAIFIPYNKLTGPGRLYWSRRGDSNRVQRAEKIVIPGSLMRLVSNVDDPYLLRGIANGDGISAIFSRETWELPIYRFAVAPGMDDERTACLAFVCNKSGEYDESDLLQIETFINGAWLILQHFKHMRELRQAKEIAEEASRSRAAFLANVNHELRTPLSSIIGYAETLSALSPNQNKLRDKCLEVIHRNAEQMLQLVEDLLLLSRSEGVQPYRFSPINLQELVGNMAEVMQPQARAWNLDITIDIPGELYIYANSNAISQVFRNLLENACRYARPATSIDVAARKNGKEVIVSVRDHGTGIDPDDMAQIFNRFYYGKQRRNSHKSMGLGLSICKYVLDCHGGRIWAENTPPGATFYFALPHQRNSIEN